MAGHSRSKNGVASLACVPAIHAFVLADALRRGCHRNSGLPEFRKLNTAVSRVNPTYGVKPGHDGASGSTWPEHALACRKPAHDQPGEPRRERGRIARDLTVEDLRLIEQQRREIGHVVVARVLLGA